MLGKRKKYSGGKASYPDSNYHVQVEKKALNCTREESEFTNVSSKLAIDLEESGGKHEQGTT